MHVLNANTLAVSEYSIQATDVAEHAGGVYFLGATGLEKLDATADLDAVAYIETGDLDLLPGASLSFDHAVLTLRADKTLTLTGTAHRDGGDRALHYTIPVRPGDRARTRFVKLAKGFRGNSWRFKLQAAGAWAVDGLAMMPHTIRTRRR